MNILSYMGQRGMFLNSSLNGIFEHPWNSGDFLWFLKICYLIFFEQFGIKFLTLPLHRTYFFIQKNINSRHYVFITFTFYSAISKIISWISERFKNDISCLQFALKPASIFISIHKSPIKHSIKFVWKCRFNVLHQLCIIVLWFTFFIELSIEFPFFTRKSEWLITVRTRETEILLFLENTRRLHFGPKFVRRTTIQ
jgi:hypothetical protein